MSTDDIEDLSEKLSPKDMKKLLAAGKQLLTQVQQASPPSQSPSAPSNKQIGK